MIEKATDLVYSALALVSLEDFKTDEAQKRFLDFQNAGIINSASRYEDPMWKLTDEYSNIGLYFKFNRFQYSNFTDRLSHISFLYESICRLTTGTHCSPLDRMCVVGSSAYPGIQL